MHCGSGLSNLSIDYYKQTFYWSNKHKLLQKIYSTLAITALVGLKHLRKKKKNIYRINSTLLDKIKSLWPQTRQKVILRHVSMALGVSLKSLDVDRRPVLQHDFLMSAWGVLYQCGLIWLRPHDTCSSISEEGKWLAAFNGPRLSSKAYWLLHAWQWESRAIGWKGSLPDSSNMPDWAQGELQLESLTSNLCILVMGYWHLSGSHHTLSGLKLLEIKTCSPSTWLFNTGK